jgi:hypothetical protein
MTRPTPAQLKEWRAACQDGTVSDAQYRDIIAAVREDRYAARPVPKVKKPRKAKAAAEGGRDPKALIDQLAPPEVAP